MARTLSTNVDYGRRGDSKPVWLISVESSESTHYWATAACNSTAIPNWSGQEFTADRLSADGIGSVKQKINLRKGGNTATIGDFKFKLVNGDAYAQDTLFAPTIEYFENRSVELRLIFKETYLRYSGMADGPFVIGEEIEGTLSGATANVLRVITLTAMTGILVIGTVTGGPFDDIAPVDSIAGDSGSGVTADVEEYLDGIPSWANGVTIFDGTVTHVSWDWDAVTFFCRSSWKTPHKKIPTKEITRDEFPDVQAKYEGKFFGLVWGDFFLTGLHKTGIAYRNQTGGYTDWAHRNYIKGKLLRPIAKTSASSEPRGILALAEHECKEINKGGAEDDVMAYLYFDDIGGFIQISLTIQPSSTYQSNVNGNYQGYDGYEKNLCSINTTDKKIYYMLVPFYDKDNSDDSDITSPQNCINETTSDQTTITADAKSIIFLFPAIDTQETISYAYMMLELDRDGDEKVLYKIEDLSGVESDIGDLATTYATISALTIGIDMSSWTSNAFHSAIKLTLKTEQVGGAYDDVHINNVSLYCQRTIKYTGVGNVILYQTVQGKMFDAWIDSGSHDTSGASNETAGDLIENPAYMVESILHDQLAMRTTTVGKSLDFNGDTANSWLKMAHSSSLAITSGNMTIIAWVYLDAHPGVGEHAGIVFKTSNTASKPAEPYEYWIDSNGKQVFSRRRDASNVDSDQVSTTAVATGSWKHIAMVYTGGATDVVVYYLQGASDGGGPINDVDGRLDGEGFVWIGRGYGDIYLNGKIDELKIYNRALSSAEITADYNSGSGKYSDAGETGLVACLHFDEGQGRDIRDSSGGGNHAGAQSAYDGTGTTMPTWAAGKVMTSATSDISEINFDTVAAIRSGWKFARHLDKSTDTFKLFKEIAYEGAFAYTPNWDGKHSVRRITKQAAALPVLDADDILANDGKLSLKISHQHVKEMRNEFVLYYQENYATGGFDRMLFVTNSGSDTYDTKFTNLASGQETYWNLCRGAWENFRQVNRWEYKAKWIRDSATAELFLKLMIKMLTPRKYICTMSSPLEHIDFELCDQSELSDALLPDAIDDTEPFICSGLRINPSDDTIDFEWTQIIDES